MKDYVKLQASLFGNYQEFDASPINSKKFLNILEEFEVLPSTYLEQGLTGMQIKQFNRLNFTSSKFNFHLKLGLNRIDIIVMYDLNTESIYKVSDFQDLIKKIFGLMMKEFRIKGNRISYISEFYDETNKKSYKDYLIPNKFFKDSIHEWNIRQHKVHEINLQGRTEKLNVIMITALSVGEIANLDKHKKLKGITHNIDINTHQNNLAFRIDFEFLNEFFDNIQEVIQELRLSYE